jgi:hypothetical protein
MRFCMCANRAEVSAAAKWASPATESKLEFEHGLRALGGASLDCERPNLQRPS